MTRSAAPVTMNYTLNKGDKQEQKAAIKIFSDLWVEGEDGLAPQSRLSEFRR